MIVHVNEISEEIADALRVAFDSEKTYRETWDWNKIISYLGKDITPDYIAPGLTLNPRNVEQQAIINNDGTMAYDVFWLEYYSEYPYEDASPVIGGSTEGIRIAVSKTGYIDDCVYVWPSKMQESRLNNVAVKIGHRSMGYGGTYENPDFYYDRYVAEFVKDGISYQVISTNISEQEFVKMVNSLTQK